MRREELEPLSDAVREKLRVERADDYKKIELLGKIFGMSDGEIAEWDRRERSARRRHAPKPEQPGHYATWAAKRSEGGVWKRW